MTTTDPTNTIPSISENLERLDAQPRPAITQACPDWCSTGPHAAEAFLDCQGGVSFNHEARYLSGSADVVVAVAEDIRADGALTRSPAMFFASLDEGETADRVVGADFARAVTKGSALFTRLTNPVDPFQNITDADCSRRSSCASNGRGKLPASRHQHERAHTRVPFPIMGASSSCTRTLDQV
jgi:hypothetical protein